MKIASLILCLRRSPVAQDWPYYGGDPAETHYSKLALINRDNVRNLKIAWEWKTGEAPMPEFKTTPGMFEATPADDRRCAVSEYAVQPRRRARRRYRPRVLAYDPKAYVDGQVPNGTGFVHRGVAAGATERRQAAHFHEQPLASDLARCGDRQAG